jgi:hypothetical protein
MTTISAMMLAIIVLLNVTMLPRIYWNWLRAGDLYSELEAEELQGLLSGRNDWVLRHLCCGVGAFILVWLAKTTPGMEVPVPEAESLSIYVVSSLLFAFLESMLAQKIVRLQASLPEPLPVRSRRG